LDVALVLATACRNAELPAAVVLLEPVDGTGVNHALVLVSVTGNWPVGNGVVRGSLPDGFWDQVRADPDLPGQDLVVLDPVGLTSALGSRKVRGNDVDLAAAASNGRDYLTSGRWRFAAAVPITVRSDGYRPAPVPSVNPLRWIYRQPGDAPSPLQSLRPEYQLTAFQARDEFTILVDVCERAEESGRTAVAVVHGVGGSGKTRLALEVAEHLRRDGWYAGVLTERLTDPASWEWLATVRAPLLVIVDYADGRFADAVHLFNVLRDRAGSPAVVILTARSADGGWLAELKGPLQSNGIPVLPEPIDLPSTPPDPERIYRATLAAQRATRGRHHAPALGVEWTTLDMVLLGWLDAQTAPDTALGQPASREQLYRQVMDHEIGYWVKTFSDLSGQPRPNRDVLAQAGALATLRQPSTDFALNEVLTAVSPLAEAPVWRDQVARTLTLVLRARDGEPMAIRPDPVADFHLITTFDAHQGLLEVSLPADLPAGQALDVVWVLNRAGQWDQEAATQQLVGAIERGQLPWQAALGVAQFAPGPARNTLEHLVQQAECALPLAELGRLIPTTPTGAYRLGLLVDERRLAEEQDPTQRPELLLQVSQRRSDNGDRAGALAAIEEAVALRRRLAEANPAVFTPDLAMSLNNLSVRRSDNGDRAGALAAIEEAVTLRRRLAEANPAVFTPNLASSALVEAGLLPPEQVWDAWRASITAVAAPFRALVCLRAANWYRERTARSEAESLAREAIQAAEQPSETLPRHVGEIRRAVRAALGSWEPPPAELPAWVTRSLPEALAVLAAEWAMAASAIERGAVIRRHQPTLEEPGLDGALTALVFVFPDDDDLEALQQVHGQIQDVGLEAVASGLEILGEAFRIITAWMDTRTWTDSVDYLREHFAELNGPECRDILENEDGYAAAQHLAILDLARAHQHDPQLFSWLLNILTDPDRAATSALASLQAGDLEQLLMVVKTNPNILDLAGTGPFVIAVILAVQGKQEQGLAAWIQKSQDSTPRQRTALAIRLKGLIKHTVDPTTRKTLSRLLDLIEDPG